MSNNEQITMNINSVNVILRKMKFVSDEVNVLMRDLDKQIINAEMDGWSDKNYQVLIDNFNDTKQIINNGLRRIEEEHIPFLERIIRTASEF